jgi:hypothetical protein
MAAKDSNDGMSACASFDVPMIFHTGPRGASGSGVRSSASIVVVTHATRTRTGRYQCVDATILTREPSVKRGALSRDAGPESVMIRSIELRF